MKTYLLATLAAVLTATPALAEMDDLGKGHLTAGFQSIGATGLNLRVDGAIDIGVMQLDAAIIAPPGNFTGFFTTRAAANFVGHTRRYLPVDLMPVMGLGFGFLMRDVPGTGTSTNTDINIEMYMPVGLRYAFGVGGFGLEAEALYHLNALNSGKADLNHWHFGVDAHTGKLLLGAFYEMGAVYNGPGARVGLAF